MKDIITDRPKYYEDETTGRAATKIIPHVLSWLDDGSTADDIREDITDAIGSYSDDGYNICRSLERSRWTPNTELVEIMDGAAHAIYTALQEREREWVNAIGLQPTRAIGDTVTFAHGDDKKYHGIITKIQADVGKYLIYCGALGHVLCGNGTHGIYLNYEDTETL